jgi:DNA polymerase IIIc chi subunit
MHLCMEPDTEVAFYNFTVTPILVGVPRLIKKIYESGHKLLVICSSEDEMIGLDKALWTFSQKDFIPHCLSSEDSYLPHINPVLLSLDEQNKNNADVVLNLSGVSMTGNFKKYLYAFYGNMEENSSMFAQYNAYKTGARAALWKQAPDGKWLQDQI